jgi:hypothetical protein
MAAKNPRPPGRPTKLSPELADRLVALLADGATTTAAAAELGVTRRTIQLRRARAWSRDPRDAPFVELAKRLRDAVASPSPLEAPVPTGDGDADASDLAPDDWREIAARLEANDPFRWGADELGMSA